MGSIFHRAQRQEADATITHVEMLKRINYGTTKVRVTYSVRPLDEPGFEVTLEAKVKMATLPQAGQEVRASYDPDRHERLEVLTPPSEERGTVTTRTVELPYFDSAHPVGAEIQQVRESVQELARQQGTSPLDQLKQLGELRDSGVLTEAEFESQKAKILAED